MGSTSTPSLSMLEARELYFKRSGLSVATYSAPTFTVKLAGIPFTFPSTATRKRILPLHDFHHILTGYGNDLIGEAEIAAWELRAGCNTLVAYWLNGSGVLLGLVLSPRRIWRAFRAARGQRSLYYAGEPYEDLLQQTVEALRRRLGIPLEGLAASPQETSSPN